jgi:hypothetical protein
MRGWGVAFRANDLKDGREGQGATTEASSEHSKGQLGPFRSIFSFVSQIILDRSGQTTTTREACGRGEVYRYVLLWIKDMDDTNTASSMVRPQASLFLNLFIFIPRGMPVFYSVAPVSFAPWVGWEELVNSQHGRREFVCVAELLDR